MKYSLPNPIKLKTLDMLERLQSLPDTFTNKNVRELFDITMHDAAVRINRLRKWGLVVRSSGKPYCKEYKLSAYGRRFKGQ